MPLRLVEFIQNGRVVDSHEVAENERAIRVEKTVRVDRSSWFAVRVTGRPSRGIGSGFVPRAHSGAVFVLVDGRNVLIREDLELMVRWIDRLWAYLEERNNFGSEENRVQALQTFDEARAHYEDKLKGI